jgi:hypothetical protein
LNNTIIVQVRYIIIETNEFSRIGYNGILFPHSYSGDGIGATHLGLHLSTRAEQETCDIQNEPLLIPDLKYLYRVLYIAFFKQIVDIFFNKAYYQVI